MIKISFKYYPDAILCLNSKLPNKNIFDKFTNIPIIAADGATNKLIKKGILPDYIIGDLDSCNREYFNSIQPENIIHIPSQDLNDFEKNLNFSISKKWKKILIFGFHGGELEHTLNNWSILKKYQTKLSLLIYDSNRYSFPIGIGEYSISSEIDEIISIIPQCKARLSTRGLKWELNNEELELGYREGTRNRALANNFIIKIHSGEVLLSMNSRAALFTNFE